MSNLNQGDGATAAEAGEALLIEMEDKSEPKPIGWNIAEPNGSTNQSYLTEVKVSHKQITDRFVELLNLFESYTRIIAGDNSVTMPRLKRTQSEQLQPYSQRETDQATDATRTSSSLTDLTLQPTPKITCEIGAQTSWSLIRERPLLLNVKAEDRSEESHYAYDYETTAKTQHTLHIEVESIASSTDMIRAPLHLRMWRVLVDTVYTMISCIYLIGENFTYVMFVFFCVWCLYLVIAHYYSFLHNNVQQQVEVKRNLARMRGPSI